VAPIALYPDALIAQILGAATYPDEVVKAEEWMEKHKHLEGDKLAKEVNKEHWDAGVKALTQFPAVLANMNQNLALSRRGKSANGRQDRRRLRLRRLSRGVSRVWRYDVHHHGEKCCQGKRSRHEHFGAREVVGMVSQRDWLGARRR
jgi:hypothetical protein